LATFNQPQLKFIRGKIDVLDKSVEKEFLNLVQALIEITSHEEFEKQQIKSQTEYAIKDVYLEILSMSGFQDRAPVPDVSFTKADSVGIQRFLLKYGDAPISTERI